MKAPKRKWEKVYELELASLEKLTFEDKLKIMDMMWKEVLSLGLLNEDDWREKIKSRIKIAKVLNCLKRS